MGNQKSQEYVSMVVPLQQTQFNVLQSGREWELWEDRISSRRYMVYSLQEKTLNDHNLQVYHFRKLNRAYLSGAHSIAQDSAGICATPTRTLLFLDHLPYTLADFGKRMTLQEGLTVLQAALSGYRMMCYLFGPLNCSQDMVWFTEGGVPKVWANQQLHLNQPSPYALEKEGWERSESGSNVSITDKKVISIRSILRTVSNSLANPFPLDFQKDIQGARSYEQAEEVVELFCRKEEIELQEWIDTRPISQQRQLLQQNSSRSLRRSDLNANKSAQSQYYQQNYYQSPKVTVPVSITHAMPQQQPIIRHQSRQYFQQIPRPSPIFIQSFPQNPQVMVAPKAVQTQTIITSYPNQSQKNTQQQLKAPPSLKTAKVSVDERINLPLIEKNQQAPKASPIYIQQQQQNTQIFENQVQTRQQISSSQMSQSSHQEDPQTEQNYQLVIHEITDNSLSHIEEPIHDKTIEMQEVLSNHASTPFNEKGRPEIELWQQSLQKMTVKMGSGKSSQCYRSEERDQVLIPETKKIQEKGITPQQSDQQFEKYIRGKYSEYFTNKNSSQKAKNGSSHQYTSSLDQKLFEKRVMFADLPQKDEEEEDADIITGTFLAKPTFSSFKKYTFGNIEPEPAYPTKEYQDYQQPIWISRQSSQNFSSRYRKQDGNLNEKYSKYVVNRSSKPVSSHFRKPQKGNTYDQLKRLLQQ